jgi:uncharacterized membrane protein
MLDAIVHTLHVILAGAWLGGIIFTNTVVSPALKSMGWDEAEQARVRSVIGRQYAKVGTARDRAPDPVRPRPEAYPSGD